MNDIKVDPFFASRLVAKSLQSSSHPSNDAEYRELIAVYRADSEFRLIVDSILRGLELQLLDWSDKGLVVVPEGQGSLFACRLSDIRSGLSANEKAALVIIFVGIATTFFPTTESLDNDEFHPPPVKLQEFRDTIHGIARKLSEEANIDDVTEALRPGWDHLNSLALISSKSENQRAGTSNLVALIKLGLPSVSIICETVLAGKFSEVGRPSR